MWRHFASLICGFSDQLSSSPNAHETSKAVREGSSHIPSKSIAQEDNRLTAVSPGGLCRTDDTAVRPSGLACPHLVRSQKEDRAQGDGQDSAEDFEVRPYARHSKSNM